MIASLPMYDRAQTAPTNDRLWTLIRAELGEGPATLTRDTDPWDDWRNPDLLFSQTCGLPFRMELHEHLHLIASPDHRLAGCAPGTYRSALVAHVDDPRSDIAQFDRAKLAYNGTDSQSGWAAPHAHAEKLGITFTPAFHSGGHRNSAMAVAQTRAEIAALDAVTWAQIGKWDDFTNSLKVVGWTDPTPALPFVTARVDLVEPLAQALENAIDALSPAERDALCLYGTAKIDASAYLALPLPPGL